MTTRRTSLLETCHFLMMTQTAIEIGYTKLFLSHFILYTYMQTHQQAHSHLGPDSTCMFTVHVAKLVKMNLNDQCITQSVCGIQSMTSRRSVNKKTHTYFWTSCFPPALFCLHKNEINRGEKLNEEKPPETSWREGWVLPFSNRTI